MDAICLSKEAYKDYERAERVRQKREKIIGRPLYIYQCGNHFHLTKRPRTETDKEYDPS